MRYKILPSGLFAEICYIGGKKDFQVESGLFRDLFLSIIFSIQKLSFEALIELVPDLGGSFADLSGGRSP